METIDYAEMLEIPVSTVNVKKRKATSEKLKDKVLGIVNHRPKSKRNVASIVLVSEFVACCVLCTLIFLTNIFVSGSAMNVFSKGIFTVTPTDKRTYADFTLSSVVSGDVEIAVSASGVMTFTADASIYPVADGTVSMVKDGTVEISHSDTFKSVIVGMRDVYYAEGDKVKGNLPIGYASGDVRIMLYEDGSLLSCFTVDETNLKGI